MPLDLHEAILAHTRWKMRLLQFIHGRSEALLVSEVERDDLCALGKWLQNEGARHAASAAYREAVQAHTEFHLRAAQVVERADSGDRAGAESMLGAGGAYAAASDAVVLALTKLRIELNKQV